jgi:hypothetical protein
MNATARLFGEFAARPAAAAAHAWRWWWNDPAAARLYRW